MEYLFTFIKWGVLVTANAVTGLIFGSAMSQEPDWYFGMLMGILTWYVIYCAVEITLLKMQKHEAVTSLTIGALIRMALQVIIVIDMWIGALVLTVTEHLSESMLLVSYATTILMGLVLSVIASVIATLVFYIRYWIRESRLKAQS